MEREGVKKQKGDCSHELGHAQSKSKHAGRSIKRADTKWGSCETCSGAQAALKNTSRLLDTTTVTRPTSSLVGCPAEVPALASNPWAQRSHNAAGTSTSNSGPSIPKMSVVRAPVTCALESCRDSAANAAVTLPLRTDSQINLKTRCLRPTETSQTN